MICPNCNTENREGAKFCDECGRSLLGKVTTTDSYDIQTERDTEKVREESIAPECTTDENGCRDDSNANPNVFSEANSDTLKLTTHASKQDLDTSDSAQGPSTQGSDTLASSTNASNYGSDTTTLAVEDEHNQDFNTSGVDTSAFDESNYDEFEERLVTEDDIKAAGPVWRDGFTMQMPRIDGNEPPRTKDYLASLTAKRRKRHRARIAFVVMIVLVVIALAAGGITYSLELWGGKSIPDVVGMTQADATAVLSDQGFIVRATQVKSDEPEGLVLVMDPASGAREPKGTEVVIHIAISRTVPDVVGFTQQEAQNVLDSEGFENVSFVPEKSDQEEHTVLSIDPPKGERAKSTTPITVVVAEAYTVPPIAGMTLEEAQQAISEAGYEPYVIYVYTEDLMDGSIIGTDPEPGAHLASGSSVSIQVARSRANELIIAAQSTFTIGSTITIGGISYEIMSLDAVEYVGNDQTTATFLARPYATFLGETVYLSARTVTATITWTDDNQISGIV